MAIIALVTERTAAEVEEAKRRAFQSRPPAKQPVTETDTATAESDKAGEAAEAAAAESTGTAAETPVGAQSVEVQSEDEGKS